MMDGSAMQQGRVPVAGGCCLAGARRAAHGDWQPPAFSRCTHLPLPLRERAGERGNQIMKHHLQMPIREYLPW